MKRLVFMLALAVAGSASAAPSHPNTKSKADAKEAFRRATQYFNLADFPRALDAFKEAYLDFPDPSFLFNIGQCQRQLGQKQEAVRSFKAYVRESPGARNLDEVQTLIASLEKLIRDEEATKNTRPQGTFGPGETPPTDPNTIVVVAPPPPPPPRTPVYKRWWLWTIVGVAAVGLGLGVGLGVGLGASSTNYPSRQFTDGTLRF